MLSGDALMPPLCPPPTPPSFFPPSSLPLPSLAHSEADFMRISCVMWAIHSQSRNNRHFASLPPLPPSPLHARCGAHALGDDRRKRGRCTIIHPRPTLPTLPTDRPTDRPSTDNNRREKQAPHAHDGGKGTHTASFRCTPTGFIRIIGTRICYFHKEQQISFGDIFSHDYHIRFGRDPTTMSCTWSVF